MQDSESNGVVDVITHVGVEDDQWCGPPAAAMVRRMNSVLMERFSLNAGLRGCGQGPTGALKATPRLCAYLVVSCLAA